MEEKKLFEKEMLKNAAEWIYKHTVFLSWRRNLWRGKTISRSDVVRLIKEYQDVGGLSSLDISVDGTEEDPVLNIKSRSSIFSIDDFFYLRLLLYEDINFGRIQFSTLEVSNGIVKCQARKLNELHKIDGLISYLITKRFGSDYFLSMLEDSLDVLHEYLNFGHSRLARPYVLVKKIIEVFPEHYESKKRKNIVRSICWWFQARFKTILFIIKNRSIYLYHFSGNPLRDSSIKSYGLLSGRARYIYAFKGKADLKELARLVASDCIMSAWRINILGLPCPTRDTWYTPNAEAFFIPVSGIAPWRLKRIDHVNVYDGLDLLGMVDILLRNPNIPELRLHVLRIINFGRYLARKNGANMNVVILFAALHDIEKNEANIPEHGAMAAKKIEGSYHFLFYNLSSNEKELVKKACEVHSSEVITGDVTIDTCLDANRLDIGRYGIEYDIEKFATEEARMLAEEYSGRYRDLTELTEII